MTFHNLAVISDIHGNADALKYALDDLARKEIGLTIVLGDLLTYGGQPNEVIDMLVEYENKHSCIFIKGNHEEFYFYPKRPKAYKMPDFVRESIAWTTKAIKGKNLAEIFYWQESFVFEGIYFSHANPYEYGNWEYVDSDDQHLKAFKALSERGYRAGVFGHSHRAKIKIIDESGTMANVTGNTIEIKKNSTAILNAGSVGQPRGTGLSYLTIDCSSEKLTAELNFFSVDLTNSENLIYESEISKLSKERLIAYLRT